MSGAEGYGVVCLGVGKVPTITKGPQMATVRISRKLVNLSLDEFSGWYWFSFMQSTVPSLHFLNHRPKKYRRVV